VSIQIDLELQDFAIEEGHFHLPPLPMANSGRMKMNKNVKVYQLVDSKWVLLIIAMILGG